MIHVMAPRIIDFKATELMFKDLSLAFVFGL
jgi:hypothetical protein